MGLVLNHTVPGGCGCAERMDAPSCACVAHRMSDGRTWIAYCDRHRENAPLIAAARAVVAAAQGAQVSRYHPGRPWYYEIDQSLIDTLRAAVEGQADEIHSER